MNTSDMNNSVIRWTFKGLILNIWIVFFSSIQSGCVLVICHKSYFSVTTTN